MTVLASRYLTRGSLYFADGPRIVAAVNHGTFVIQPPGYWLYAHLAALFPNPSTGLAFWNEFFSASGAAVFYLLLRNLVLHRVLSFLATLAYASVYFAWFAGVTHSSYASQLLFAPLTMYCFFKYREGRSFAWLLLCGAAIGVGTGLRPSDGVFLLPLWVYLTWRCVDDFDRRLWLSALVLLLSTAWYLPTEQALAHTHDGHGASWLRHVSSSGSSVFSGIGPYSEANVVRVVLPLASAFWPLLPLLFIKRNRPYNLLPALWALPGIAFLLLFYMSDASYLTFSVGAFVLGAALSTNRALATVCLSGCFLFNTLLYLAVSPLHSNTAAARAMNFYVVKYCDYGVRHQWMTTYGRNGRVPYE